MVHDGCKPARFPFSIACHRVVALIEAIDSLPAEEADAPALESRLRAQEDAARVAGCLTVAELARGARDYAADIHCASLLWKAIVMGYLLNHIPNECLFGQSPDRATEGDESGACRCRRRKYA
jgi:hypothetical protein